MGEEYCRWLEEHPNATDEEKRQAWNDYLMRMEARSILIEMLAALR